MPIEHQIEIIYPIAADNGINGAKEQLLDDIMYPINSLATHACFNSNNDPDICDHNFKDCQHLFHNTMAKRTRMTMFEQHCNIERAKPKKVVVLGNLAMVEATIDIISTYSEDLSMYYILLRNEESDEYQFYRCSTDKKIQPEFLETLSIGIDHDNCCFGFETV